MANDRDTDQAKLPAFEAAIGAVFDDLRLAGLAAGILQDGELWWFKGYGYADTAKLRPVTPDTPFHLASLTKTYASTLLLQLVEQGKLDLDTPAADFGIELESLGTVTVRHIFTHTSSGVPGEHYRYDGSRFGKLDQVIEQITGRSFGAQLDQVIIDPLGLKNTGGMRDKLAVPLAAPYELNDARDLMPGRYPEYFGSSAGLVASLADYATYLNALKEHRFLKPETQALAFTPAKTMLGTELPYGLGWFVQRHNGTKVIWHYGYWNSVSTLVVIVPDRDLTFLAFANTDGLSRGFDLGDGDVTRSPAGKAFLNAFVPHGNRRAADQRDHRIGSDRIAAAGPSGYAGAEGQAVRKEQAMAIEQRPFGRTGHMSSAVIFGAAALSRSDQATADKVLDLLFQHGVNHIDTAPRYGDAELRIGPWMDKHRKEFFLATKVAERDYEGAKASVHRSLERLRTDHLDLIQMHALVYPDDCEQVFQDDGALRALVEAREEGLVKHIGITGHGWTIAAMHRRNLERFDFDSILMPWNWLAANHQYYRPDFDETLAICRERNIAVQTIKGIARGAWAAGVQPNRTTWYQPIEDEEAIRQSVHWVLGLEGIFLNSAGDVSLLPTVLAAADDLAAQPSDAVMAEMSQRMGLASIFGI